MHIVRGSHELRSLHSLDRAEGGQPSEVKVSRALATKPVKLDLSSDEFLRHFDRLNIQQRTILGDNSAKRAGMVALSRSSSSCMRTEWARWPANMRSFARSSCSNSGDFSAIRLSDEFWP